MNNRTYAYYRDRDIVRFINLFKCLDSNQIQLIFFNETCNPESAIRQTQNVMKRLTEKKLVKKWRLDSNEPYKYFIEDFEQKEHIVLLNWLVIYFINKLKYEKVYYMEYQRNYVVKIPDLFMVTYNFATNKYHGYFFEMDRSILNKFDAIDKYLKLFEAKPLDEHMSLIAPHFPHIVIATVDPARLKQINKLREKEEEQNRLHISTHLVWDIREECINEKVAYFRYKFMDTII